MAAGVHRFFHGMQRWQVGLQDARDDADLVPVLQDCMITARAGGVALLD